MTDAPAYLLDGQVIVSRIVAGDDVLVVTDKGDLSVFDAVAMLTMATDTVLHEHEHADE